MKYDDYVSIIILRENFLPLVGHFFVRHFTQRMTLDIWSDDPGAFRQTFPKFVRYV